MAAKINISKLKATLKDAKNQVINRKSLLIEATAKNKFLSLIEKGISPIEGNGRFPAYKAQGRKKGAPKKYPDSVRSKFPTKRKRPVNLLLSGKFLKQLKFDVKGTKLTYGHSTTYGKTLEQGHREGANSQGIRPIIPTRGEELATSIKTAILKILNQGLKEYLRARR